MKINTRSDGIQTRKKETDSKLNYRNFSVRLDAQGRPSSLDDEARTVEVIGATEAPVDVFDMERFEIVPEVLLMTGLEMPRSRQVPLLDTHDRFSAASVLGSYREMRVENDQLMGRVHFASVGDAEPAYQLTREGHLTDFSAGYRPIESHWVPDGEKQTINGKSFSGPVKVTTRWRIKELSIVPIGADEDAKARSEYEHQNHSNQQESEMNKKLRDFLEARGLSKDATEEQAWAYLETLQPEEKRKAPQSEPQGQSQGQGQQTQGQGQAPAQNQPQDVDQIRAAAMGEERSRITEIDAMCRQFKCTDMAEKLIKEGTAVDEARKAVLEHLAQGNADPGTAYRGPVERGADERDKFRTAAHDALLVRGGVTVEKPAQGADDLTGYSLREMARLSLRMANQRDTGEPMAMIGRAFMTSDFPLVLANVAEKSLFEGFEAAAETWQTWVATGSVSDFKTHHSVRASESSDLQEIPEGTPYPYGERSEAQEQYSIVTHGLIEAITRQTIINDDLGAIIDVYMDHGEAVSRKIGDVVYAVLTANSAMGDGVALFHTATHGNLAGSGAAVAVDPLAAGIKAMKTQKDLQGKRRLNIRPAYFIAPAAIEGIAEQFFRTNDLDATGSTDAVKATANPYAGNYFSRVYEPRLDDDSATAWYLAARKGKTVKLFFLNGVQRPYLESQNGWNVDGVEMKVRIDCGAKAMDWRGLYKNPGA